ncbi:hypothetical protein HH308_06330 [Gordonia sp. TBRC 11910]|uniref:Uncharacterized protein n=1 Tax=Gordonia asplenii TaxID=2725283 RepID=A0A848KRV4_9ACTN|nr:hypothetical protein [Gordonia asplenii]NMO00829.1 hypothetical protein [Gordonia asplenii]
MRTVTVANPDKALDLINTFNYSITTAEVLRVDEYGALVLLINADGTKQTVAHLLGRWDFRAIFGEEFAQRARLGDRAGIITETMIGWGEAPDDDMVVFIPDINPDEAVWEYRFNLVML